MGWAYLHANHLQDKYKAHEDAKSKTELQLAMNRHKMFMMTELFTLSSQTTYYIMMALVYFRPVVDR